MGMMMNMNHTKRIVAGLSGAAVLVGGGIALHAATATAAVPPTITNLAASNVTDNSATANCSVDANDNTEVQVFVVYKKSSDTWSAGPVSSSDRIPATGDFSQTISIPLPVQVNDDGTDSTDLLASTSYDYRCKVNVNADGASPLVDTATKTFTTSADVQTITNVEGRAVQQEGTPDADGNLPELSDTAPLATDRFEAVCLSNPKGATKVWAVAKKSSDTWANGPVLGEQSGDATLDQTGTRTQQATFLFSGLTHGVSYDFRCKSDIDNAPLIVDSNTKTFVIP
jgi:hypothetical protein